MIVLSSNLDATTRAIATALRKALEEPSDEEVASAIALPAADEHAMPSHLAGVEVVLALDAAQVERAREAGVPTVLYFSPYLDLEPDALRADRVFVVHEALTATAIELGARRAQVKVVGPIAPDGWTPADDRAALRERLGFGADRAWVLVRAEALLRDDLAPALVQLSLVQRPTVWLFDVGAEPDLARTLRRQVPGYGLDAVMVGDGQEALDAYRAADAVLGAFDGPEAIRAFATGAAFVGVAPRSDQLRLAHAVETSGIADLADAPATLAVTLDAILAPAALEKARAVSAALDAVSGAARVAEAVHDTLRGGGDGEGRVSGVPRGFERLSSPDGGARTRAPTVSPREEKSVDDELAALRKKLGL